jgi:cold shock CspA family protein
VRGSVKLFNVDKGFGFIKTEDHRGDLFFHISEVRVRDRQIQKGDEVSFEIKENAATGKTSAVKIVFAASEGSTDPMSPVGKMFIPPKGPGSYLSEWAFFYWDHEGDADKTKPIPQLASMALEELWDYEDSEGRKEKYSILKGYIKYTFYRLYNEKKIHFSTEKDYAVFNTGLVNKLYDPIYGIFEPNKKSDKQPWHFMSFCCVNEGKFGDILGENFKDLPPAPKYFEKPEDLIFDPDSPIRPDWKHIIQDAIERDRYPYDFLAQNLPSGLHIPQRGEMGSKKWSNFLRDYVEGISKDSMVERRIRHIVENAINTAVKRARWNFKTAIPTYYPRQNCISLLLPMGLVHDEKIDVALVISKTKAGGYTGETVYPLNWAYSHSRLVCRPQSDWLTLDVVSETSSSQMENFID